MTQQWRVLVTWRRPEQADDIDRLSALTQALPGFGIVHDDGDAARLEAAMTVQAPTIRQAAEAGLREARAAHAAAFGTAGEPLRLRVLTLEEHDAEVARPSQMELMGLREAAAELGISPQRVDQLARENPEFPAPVARLAAGAVFTAASIRAVKERGWRRTPGRPRKTA
ncbi:hypothetical protein CSH63_33200 [Micromonospora tulbaghiae]|uniref:Uncharacterized protein n=1 Tax=Micromonospora tulbaghiae TaxID=479978 RepID=A0A386WW34_9ACTN|nr:hypothetical protein [Micromonospora tulbaghiae]AYF32213.1 hypothetical protein CSH63_33200 [Micromonospora tulbaghiae]